VDGAERAHRAPAARRPGARGGAGRRGGQPRRPVDGPRAVRGGALTDVADGWLARRLGQCTDFGALSDPIADKALVATALVCLSASGLVPWWATTVILAREVAVTMLQLGVLRHGVIPASRGGKVTTVTQTALIVLALATPGWTDVLTAVVLVTVVWTVGTGLDYGGKAAVLSGARGLGAGAPPGAGRRGSVPHPAPLVPDAGLQQGGGGASSRVRS
jgi:CDP-diacylglycerol--glycerol-3-phosphate 3-phosphatidyltransferase